MIYFLDIFVIPLNFAQKIAGEWIVSMQQFENKNIWCLMEHKHVWDVLQKDVQLVHGQRWKVMVISNVMYLKRNEMIEKLWIFLMFQGGGGGAR